MASENEFVQKVRFEVDDGELHASIERFQQALGKASDLANGKFDSSLSKAAASANETAKETARIGKEAQKAASETGKIAKESKNAERETGKLEGAFSKLKGAISGAVAAYMGFQGLSKLVSFGRESVELFNTQMRQERQLQTVLENKGLGSELEGIKRHASEIQKRTLYGDEAMLAGAGELATYVSSGESMKRMMNLLANYAAGMTGGTEVTPQQMVDLATGLGKAFDGTYDAMRKKGFDTSELEELSKREKNGEEISDDMKIAALEKSLSDWNGLAEVFAQSDEGKIIQLKNEIGDVKEEIGRELLPVFADLAREVKSNMPSIQRLFQSFSGILKSLMHTLSDNVGTISVFSDGLASILNLFSKAPLTTLAFAGSLKYMVPMMDAAQKGTLSFGASLSGLGKGWQAFLKAGLFTATLWGLQQIFKAGKAIKELMAENDRQNAIEGAREIQGQIESGTYFSKRMDEISGDMRRLGQQPIVMDGLSKMAVNEKGDFINADGSIIDFETLGIPFTARELQRKYNVARYYSENADAAKAYGKKLVDDALSMKGGNLGADGWGNGSAPEFEYTPVDMDAEMQKALQSAAKVAKGDTNVTNIEYTNNIKTDSDMTARLIKENLRTLLQSQLTFRTRAETVKAIGL